MTPPLPAKLTPPVEGREARNQSTIKVLVVDDSAVVRGLLARLISEQPDLEVAATAANGQMALNAIAERSIDRRGAVVVVRPDQYVAAVLPLDAPAELDAFLSRAFGG